MQPFEHLGIRVYILASQSCASSYSNDTTFQGWDKLPKSNPKIKNNCYLWCSKPINAETVEGYSNWLKSCPVWPWVVASSIITFGEEMLTEYGLQFENEY